MSDLIIPFAQLQDAASQFTNQAGDLEIMLSKIQEQLNSLSGAFRGKTAEKFQILMEEWTKDAGNIQQVLAQVGQGLTKTVERFQEEDVDISGLF